MNEKNVYRSRPNQRPMKIRPITAKTNITVTRPYIGRWVRKGKTALGQRGSGRNLGVGAAARLLHVERACKERKRP